MSDFFPIIRPKPIKVVQLFYSFDVEVGGGGLTRFAIELGRALDRKRFEVEMVGLGFYQSELAITRINSLSDEGYQSYQATNWEIEHPYRSFFSALRNLQRRFKLNPPDILHSHSEYTDVTALLLKVMQVAPSIVRTVHYGNKFEWMKKPIHRAVLTNFLYPLLFDREIGINQVITDRLNGRRVSKLINKKTRRIFNAVPMDNIPPAEFDPTAKKIALGIRPSAPVVGSVGRLAEQKGYHYFVEAIPIVLESIPETHFLIVGDGPLAQEIREFAAARGLTESITFTGGRPDVPELLACMDLFVSSSLWEGLPTVIMESMINQVPVLATDIPGTRELIQHQQNGWLVPAKQPVTMAEAIVYLMNSPYIRQQLADNARISVSKYSITEIAKEYEELYLQLMANKLPHPH